MFTASRPAAHFFSYETEFRKKAEKHSQRIQHGKKGRGEQLWPSYICLSTFYNPSPKWKVEMITQETNPVYWACTHCLTLEPWTVIISTFILVVQFDNTLRFATLESVRPGLTAKGSFKNSKSKGRNLLIHHLCETFHFIIKCVTGKCNMTAVV